MILASIVTCDHVVGEPPVAYTLPFCPRCRGRGTYNAFNILASGQVQMLTGYSSLEQSIRKILTEDQRSSGYGLNHSIFRFGTVPQSNIQDSIRSEVFRTVQYLVTVQQQEKARGFTYLPTEEIQSVDDVHVQVAPGDPRKYQVTVYLTTVSGRSSQVSQLVGG